METEEQLEKIKERFKERFRETVSKPKYCIDRVGIKAETALSLPGIKGFNIIERKTSIILENIDIQNRKSLPTDDKQTHT